MEKYGTQQKVRQTGEDSYEVSTEEIKDCCASLVKIAALNGKVKCRCGNTILKVTEVDTCRDE